MHKGCGMSQCRRCLGSLSLLAIYDSPGCACAISGRGTNLTPRPESMAPTCANHGWRTTEGPKRRVRVAVERARARSSGLLVTVGAPQARWLGRAAKAGCRARWQGTVVVCARRLSCVVGAAQAGEKCRERAKAAQMLDSCWLTAGERSGAGMKEGGGGGGGFPFYGDHGKLKGPLSS